jgi:1-phosphofructokinase family hexose kinase
MINILCANPCVDKVYSVQSLSEGEMHRIKTLSITPGGKGVNVAKALVSMGIDACVYGFNGGSTGEWLENELKKKGIKNSFIECLGSTRTNINIISKKTKSETELLEEGFKVKKSDADKLFQKILGNTNDKSVFIISGSLPGGVNSDFYYEIIKSLKKKKIKVILDTSEENLKKALSAKPYIIKPNLRELAYISGMKLLTNNDILKAIEKVHNKYDINIFVSMGKNGGIYKTRDIMYKIEIPDIKTVNTIGSGDVLTAGLGYGLYKKMDIEEILQEAVCMAISNTQYYDIGRIDKLFMDKIRKKIIISKC